MQAHPSPTYCAAAGMQAKIFSPAAAPPAKLAQMAAMGADVRAIEGPRQNAADAALAEADKHVLRRPQHPAVSSWRAAKPWRLSCGSSCTVRRQTMWWYPAAKAAMLWAWISASASCWHPAQLIRCRRSTACRLSTPDPIWQPGRLAV